MNTVDSDWSDHAINLGANRVIVGAVRPRSMLEIDTFGHISEHPLAGRRLTGLRLSTNPTGGMECLSVVGMRWGSENLILNGRRGPTSALAFRKTVEVITGIMPERGEVHLKIDNPSDFKIRILVWMTVQ